jgi:ATP-dependent Clp protease ATP-binding subunit ClpB
MSDVGLKLQVSDAAKAQIADEGFDPAYGARPIKRVIQQQIANPLATNLLAGKAVNGQTVRIDYQDEEFTFTPL